MGVLNVAPDSFYSGSRAQGRAAVKMALEMEDEGADIIDIGGQSTRPGSERVGADEELARISPVISALVSKVSCKLSIDTYNYGVAKFAAGSGVQVINDITGMGSKPMRELVADNGLECVIMHMKGSPKTMQVNPHYGNVIREIKKFLGERVRLCERDGVSKGKIIVDPGIGFGKSPDHNIEILKNIDEFKTLRKRVLVGASRKSFIGRINGGGGVTLDPDQRLEGSLAVACYCTLKDVDILRVHDVKETVRAVEVMEALR